jgi:hypothetical protein
MPSDPSEFEQHRAQVYEALSRHSDPLLREMGKQLAAGTVAPHELLSEPRYVEVLRRGMRHVAETGDDELRARLIGPPGADGGAPGDGGVPTGRR